MSIYKDLNEIEIDLSQFEIQPLSKLEQKRVQKKVKRKLYLNKRHTGYSVGAAVVLAIGLLTVNHQTIANMPFIAGLLEDWSQSQDVEWEPYKNSIGITASTALGNLTLNEVIIDYDKILISSTFQKAEDVKFSYQYQLIPTILIDGKAVEGALNGAQSIAQNSEMFIIYNEITLPAPIEDANISMQLVYDHMQTPSFDEPITGVKLAEPWTFDITASQLSVQQQTIVKELHQHIPLNNDDSFFIDKIITTPISTTIHYSGAASDHAPDIMLYDENNQSYHWSFANSEDDGTGVLDFSGVSFVNKKMFLEVSLDDEVISERIVIEGLGN